MYVYFIRTKGKPSRIKIGKARDPEKRMAAIQTGCPYPLELMAKIKCTSDRHAYSVEKAVHDVMAKYRKQGEWFRASDKVIVDIWNIRSIADQFVN